MMARKSWRLLAAMPAGLLAWASVALAADKVYVANEGAGTVGVLDAASFKALASVRVGKMPHNVQVSPDGKVAWVTNDGEPGQADDAAAHQGMSKGDHNAMAKTGAVWVIDTSRDTVIAKVPVGTHPAHVVVSPDGRLAFVSLSEEDAVAVIDPATHKVIRKVGAGAHGVAVDRGGRYAYVTNTYANSVSVLDIKNRKVVATVRVGKGPNGISVTP